LNDFLERPKEDEGQFRHRTISNNGCAKSIQYLECFSTKNLMNAMQTNEVQRFLAVGSRDDTTPFETRPVAESLLGLLLKGHDGTHTTRSKTQEAGMNAQADEVIFGLS
jgi:hypothetical protein